MASAMDMLTEIGALRGCFTKSAATEGHCTLATQQRAQIRCEGCTPVQSEYTTALDGAERSVNRLSCAIEVADEKVDHALRVTDEVHKQAATHREQEIQTLRQVILAKEQGIDSLRGTLSCTKRNLEGRVRDLEQALRNRDSQLAAMQEKIAGCEESHADLVAHSQHLRKQLESTQAAHTQQDDELRSLVQDSQAALKHLRCEKEGLSDRCAAQQEALQCSEKNLEDARIQQRELQKQLQAANQNVEQLVASCRVLRKKVLAERNVRKTSEQWLRAELKSREDLESLFSSVRDITLAKEDHEEKADKVKHLIDEMRSQLQYDCNGRIRQRERSKRPAKVLKCPNARRRGSHDFIRTDACSKHTM